MGSNPGMLDFSTQFEARTSTNKTPPSFWFPQTPTTSYFCELLNKKKTAQNKNGRNFPSRHMYKQIYLLVLYRPRRRQSGCPGRCGRNGVRFYAWALMTRRASDKPLGRNCRMRPLACPSQPYNCHTLKPGHGAACVMGNDASRLRPCWKVIKTAH